MTKGYFVAIVIILVLIGAVGLAMFLVEETDRVEDEVVLRLGYRPGALGDITPVVLSEFNLISSDLRVETVPVPDPGTGMDRLLTGEIDAVAGMPLESIIAELQGEVPFHAYALAMDVEGNKAVSLVGNRQMDIEVVGDLAGQPVASLPTPQAQWLVERILIEAGIPSEEVNIVTYNPATPLAGMEAGEHAAIFGLEPAISRAIQEGHFVLEAGPISKFLYGGEPVVSAASLISNKFREENPEAYQEFQNTFREAVELVENRPDDIREFLTGRAYGELSPEVAEEVSFVTLITPEEADRELTERFINDLLQDGIIDEEIDLAPFFPEQ